MSGELQVVFIYDTLRCRKEEDDPRDAILYFHPEEISESRRIAICGQLMGITHFLIDFFSAPKILTLENGKFALRDFGRQYVLALGCSSVTPDWLLEKQADILYQLTRFFHKDIDSILKTVNGDRHLLSSKLASIMDHYIPISQHHGDLFALTFGILPIVNLPKSASHISLNATVILQTCMLRDGVLGGIVMFQNKVVGVELVQDIAQKLAFIQPYQLPPADPAVPSFMLPPGVQLLKVYIKQNDLENLKKHSSTYQYPSRFEPNLLNGKENSSKGKIDPIREEDPSDVSSSLGFSEPSSESNPPSEELQGDTSLTFSSLGAEIDEKEIATKNGAASEIGRKGFSDGIKWNLGKDTGEVDGDNRKFSVAGPPPCVHKNGCGSNFLHPPRLFRSLENLSVQQNEDEEKRSFSSSLNDPFFPYIRCDGKSISRYLLESYAYPNQTQDETDDADDEEVHVPKNFADISKSKKHETGSRVGKPHDFNKSDKMDLINSCEEVKDTCVPEHQNQSNNEKSLEDIIKNVSEKSKVPNFKPSSGLSRPKDLALNTSSRVKSKRRWSTFDDMMSPLIENPPSVIEFDTQPREKSASFSNTEPEFIFKKLENEKEDSIADVSTRSRLLNSFRKLSSPEDINSSVYNSASESGKDSGCSGDKSLNLAKIKPQSDNKSNHPFTSLLRDQMSSSSVLKPQKKRPTPSSMKSKQGPQREASSDSYENALLFIYSLGGMRLLLLMEKETLGDMDLMQALWDYGSSSIAELEIALSNVEEQSMSMGAGHHDHYCYLHYEPVWRSLAHGGRNHSMDFDVVQHMHQDFQIYPTINELIIRGEDHVVYGYQCVGSEVFYQQSAGPQPGLPMPSDLMGKVPVKAKRRLERDHNILLL